MAEEVFAVLETDRLVYWVEIILVQIYFREFYRNMSVANFLDAIEYRVTNLMKGTI